MLTLVRLGGNQMVAIEHNLEKQMKKAGEFVQISSYNNDISLNKKLILCQ